MIKLNQYDRNYIALVSQMMKKHMMGCLVIKLRLITRAHSLLQFLTTQVSTKTSSQDANLSCPRN